MSKKEEKSEKKSDSDSKEEVTKEEKKTIELPEKITVKNLAEKIKMPVTEVIAELMKNGVLASQNESIDFETASIIADEMGFEANQVKKADKVEEKKDAKLEEALEQSQEENLVLRPPVVVVLGHVDHGKTLLLDAIRETKVIDTEHGGITQHIGAYQVKEKSQLITFIDTPGHAAFTAMRSRGAKIADIAILVIAADDSIKPQTKEALQIIKAAKIPYIIAINKIDKAEADVNRVMKDLADHDLLPEEWGGDTITVEVSALEKKGLDDLLSMVLLVYDMEKDYIKADPSGQAIGSIIESHIDKGEGPVATVLIHSGTLEVGNDVTVGDVWGRIKAMKDFKGGEIEKAKPSTPVKILGLKGLPVVGDIISVTEDLKEFKKKAKQYRHDKHLIKPSETRIETKKQKDEEEEKTEEKEEKREDSLKLILKADNLGSLEAIMESLKKYQHEEVRLVVVYSGLGNITEADMLKAEATGAIVRGFNVSANKSAENLAHEKGMEYKIYKVIYELFEEIKLKMEELLKPTIEEKLIGRMKVLAVFRTEKKLMIVGGRVTYGKFETGMKAKVLRNKEEIGRGKITKLQIEDKAVKEVEKGRECGVTFKGKVKIEENDTIEVFEEEKIYKKININNA
ncbi:MAG: translation initiation factor IF-2 [Patescibacteria group bacterium]|nr:translation initiation factor IF-2 [Patescibacteria group bacterium]